MVPLGEHAGRTPHCDDTALARAITLRSEATCRSRPMRGAAWFSCMDVPVLPQFLDRLGMGVLLPRAL